MIKEKHISIDTSFYETMTVETGCHSYLYSATPLVLTIQLFEDLNQSVRDMLDVIDTKEYFDFCLKQDNWNLPTRPLKLTDYSGCADFLMTREGAKLIEMNINLPGKIGLAQTLGNSAQKFINKPTGNWLNLDFNLKLKNEILRALPKAQNIALVVSHLSPSRIHMAHYQYFSEQLNATGLKTKVVFANRVEVVEKGMKVGEELFDGCINLVIPFVWEDNLSEFRMYTQFLEKQPDLIFPNPTGGMLGTKELLSYLSDKRDDSESSSWRNYVLKAHALSNFDSIDALQKVYALEQMVLKPLKDYNATGVYVEPNQEQLDSVFFNKKDQYMVQEYTDSLENSIETVTGDILKATSTILRMFFASKEPIAYQAYYVVDDYRGSYYSAPVMRK